MRALLLIAALAQVRPGAKTPAAAAEKGLTPRSVLAAIEARRDEVRNCRDANLTGRNTSDAAPGGTVKLSWVIGKDGRTSQVDVVERGTTIGDSILRLCLVNAVRRWSFPASDISTSIEYPFEFPRVASSYADERTIRANAQTVRSCMMAARDRLPFQLVLMVHFRVGDRGEPQQIDIDSSPAIRDEALRACVVRAVRDWRFEPVAFGRNDGVVTASWTFTGVGILDIQGFHAFGSRHR